MFIFIQNFISFSYMNFGFFTGLLIVRSLFSHVDNCNEILFFYNSHSFPWPWSSFSSSHALPPWYFFLEHSASFVFRRLSLLYFSNKIIKLVRKIKILTSLMLNYALTILEYLDTLHLDNAACQVLLYKLAHCRYY